MLIEFDNPQHCSDLIRLNELWISAYFSIEDADRKLVADPFKIVRDGGHIISLVLDDHVVGVCALIADGSRRFQLARMAVEPSQRGKGYGSILIRAAIERAKTSGAESVYLLSNTKLQAAIALYQNHGFQTVAEGPHPLFARCNIVMELSLLSSPA